jgi:hypothetical protein
MGQVSYFAGGLGGLESHASCLPLRWPGGVGAARSALRAASGSRRPGPLRPSGHCDRPGTAADPADHRVLPRPTRSRAPRSTRAEACIRAPQARGRAGCEAPPRSRQRACAAPRATLDRGAKRSRARRPQPRVADRWRPRPHRAALREAVPPASGRAARAWRCRHPRGRGDTPGAEVPARPARASQQHRARALRAVQPPSDWCGRTTSRVMFTRPRVGGAWCYRLRTVVQAEKLRARSRRARRTRSRLVAGGDPAL